VSAAVIAAPADPDDDGGNDVVLDRVPCACGRLAAMVMDGDADTVWCSMRCACGALSVPADEGDPR
jgi:hypothetical protein